MEVPNICKVISTCIISKSFFSFWKFICWNICLYFCILMCYLHPFWGGQEHCYNNQLTCCLSKEFISTPICIYCLMFHNGIICQVGGDRFLPFASKNTVKETFIILDISYALIIYQSSYDTMGRFGVVPV